MLTSTQLILLGIAMGNKKQTAQQVLSYSWLSVASSWYHSGIKTHKGIMGYRQLSLICFWFIFFVTEEMNPDWCHLCSIQYKHLIYDIMIKEGYALKTFWWSLCDTDIKLKRNFNAKGDNGIVKQPCLRFKKSLPLVTLNVSRDPGRQGGIFNIFAR